jgi:DNA invertase Pin-like site-specific DNA recombinase
MRFESIEPAAERVALYARVSHDDLHVENQQGYARDYAERLGIRLLDPYVEDDAISGATPL